MTSITLTEAKVVFDDITVKTSLNTEKNLISLIKYTCMKKL